MAASSSPSRYGFRTNASTPASRASSSVSARPLAVTETIAAFDPRSRSRRIAFQSAHAGHAQVHEHQIADATRRGSRWLPRRSPPCASGSRCGDSSSSSRSRLVATSSTISTFHAGWSGSSPIGIRVRDASRDGVGRPRRPASNENVNTLPFPGRALDDEVSLHQAREVAADGQAEARAADAGRRVRLIERIEDPREILRLDARSRVLDGDRHDVPVAGRIGRARRERRSVPRW